MKESQSGPVCLVCGSHSYKLVLHAKWNKAHRLFSLVWWASCSDHLWCSSCWVHESVDNYQQILWVTECDLIRGRKLISVRHQPTQVLVSSARLPWVCPVFIGQGGDLQQTPQRPNQDLRPPCCPTLKPENSRIKSTADQLWLLMSVFLF